MSSQNSHSKWLRTWAAELRKEGVIGGANTAEQAADEIDRLEDVVAHAETSATYWEMKFKGTWPATDCEHEFGSISINNAESPLDPQKLYTYRKCVKCGDHAPTEASENCDKT